jgi:signal transduction histidine kinase/phage shock protein PspC (stress-responsive transcriptional regulator)
MDAVSASVPSMPPGTAAPSSPSAPSSAPTVRPKLYRSADGRILGGVAQGLAVHLRVEPWVVRVAFLVFAFSGGAGIVAYVAFWALAPLSPDGRPPGTAGPVAAPTKAGSTAATAADDAAARPGPLGPLVALTAVAAGALLLAAQLGFGPSGPVAIPVLVLGLGVAVLWRASDDAQRARWRRTATINATGRRAWVRVVLGVTLVVVGAAAVLGTSRGAQAGVDALAGALVVVGGVAVVAGPWIYRSTRERAEERRALIRSEERAELAAHVHDSVVQTLTLIQRNADDPRTVTRLARAEERALRRWLYQPEGPAPGSFRAALEQVAAEVEDVHGVTVEVVVVGDTQVDETVAALLQAAREAMVNAAKYAGEAGPVSVYAEVEPQQVSVFVRDRGPGFDVAAVPPDRLGVRQSIVGRMERHGGTAEIVTAPGEGAEVRLSIPHTEQEEPS